MRQGRESPRRERADGETQHVGPIAPALLMDSFLVDLRSYIPSCSRPRTVSPYSSLRACRFIEKNEELRKNQTVELGVTSEL